MTAGGKAKREATGKFTFRGPEILGSAVDWAGHLRLMKTSAKGRASDKAKKHEMEIVLSKVLLPVTTIVLQVPLLLSGQTGLESELLTLSGVRLIGAQTTKFLAYQPPL